MISVSGNGVCSGWPMLTFVWLQHVSDNHTVCNVERRDGSVLRGVCFPHLHRDLMLGSAHWRDLYSRNATKGVLWLLLLLSYYQPASLQPFTSPHHPISTHVKSFSTPS